MLVLNQVLLAAKVGVGYLVDAVPAFIRDEQARARASEYQVNLRQRQESHSVAAQGRAMRSLASPADEEEEGEGVLNSLRSSAGNVLRAPAQWASNITGVGALLNRGSGGAGSYGADQDQSLHSLHDNGAGPNSPGGENRLRPSSRDDAISRLLAEQQSSKFGLDPLGLTVVVVLPAALQYWGISPWLYIPAAVLYLSYLQVQKNRFDRKMAIGIVSDPALIKLGESNFEL